MYHYYLSIGSNLGCRERYIKEAVEKLGKSPFCDVVKVSSLYETKPWGKTDQPSFLNNAVCVKTWWDGVTLLAYCQEIERELGRVRHEKWGPRTIDIDIICSDHGAFHGATLTIPHPFCTQRAFVLVPLCEIAPQVRLGKVTAKEALALCKAVDEVKLWKGEIENGETDCSSR